MATPLAPEYRLVREATLTKNERHVARDISYATTMRSRYGRWIVRSLENATGRIGLIRRARGYSAEVAAGRDIWQVMCDRYGLSLTLRAGTLGDIPATGPVVVVSNHPFGILDGLLIGHILSLRRGGDFRVMAHRVFINAPDLQHAVLPIAFDETKEAAKMNLETRAEAVRYLRAGGCVGIFPGGTVSTAQRRGAPALDPVWRNFTAKMVAKSGATVVPIFFDGENSQIFQIASRMHYMLRMGLLIREFRRRVDRPVSIAVGKPIGPDQLARFGADSKAMMDFLRKATYDLSPTPVMADQLGYEFEAKYRKRDGSRGF